MPSFGPSIADGKNFLIEFLSSRLLFVNDHPSYITNFLSCICSFLHLFQQSLYLGFNGLPVGSSLSGFPYSTPLLAMGNSLLSPLMMNANSALASFASAAANTHHTPGLPSLTTPSSASPAPRQSPAVQVSHSPKVISLLFGNC